MRRISTSQVKATLLQRPTLILAGLLTAALGSVLGFHLQLTSQAGERFTLTSEGYRALVVARTADELEQARLTSVRQAERQVERLLLSLRSRARDQFAPWMFDYGQSVKVDVDRAEFQSTFHWGLGDNQHRDYFGAQDIDLVRYQFASSVATGQHFINMLALVENSAKERYRNEASARLARLREEFVVTASPIPVDQKTVSARGTRSGAEHQESPEQVALGPAGQQLAMSNWAEQYFLRLEASLASDEASFPAELHNESPLTLYQSAFLDSIAELLSRAESPVPEGIAAAIDRAQAHPEGSTATAAMLLTWYVTEMPDKERAGVAKLSRLIDFHFDAVKDRLIDHPDLGTYGRLTRQHLRLLEVSQAA